MHQIQLKSLKFPPSHLFSYKQKTIYIIVNKSNNVVIRSLSDKSKIQREVKSNETPHDQETIIKELFKPH